MNAQELRPMGIGDILDMTFRLYRKRFLAFLTISLVCYVPFALFMAVIPVLTPAPSESEKAMARQVQKQLEKNPLAALQRGTEYRAVSKEAQLATGLGALLFGMVVFPLCTAAMTHNISASYLGEMLPAGASYARSAPRLIPLLWTNFLVILAVYAGIIMCIVPGIIFGLWFMLTTPVVILERTSGSKAIGRSRDLMRGNISKGFVLMLVVGILSIIISVALSSVIGLIPWPHHAFQIFFQNVLSAIIVPLQTAPLILLYYDLRIRKEAFDLHRLSETLGKPAAIQ